MSSTQIRRSKSKHLPIFILDTDHVSLFQRRHPSVVRRVRASPPERIAVTVVTFEEQMRGWLNAIRQSSSGQALVAAYSRLHGALAYYQAIQVISVNPGA